MNATCSGVPHTFHIPVMGTGFTIDTPLRVARYGISSVVSLVDDILIEQMRRLHSEREGEPFEAIPEQAEDSRARRITAYLDLLDRVVARQMETLRAAPFLPGSDITRYYELLPESPLKRKYRRMLETTDPTVRAPLEGELRDAAVPGSIDVNIMTKVDRRLSRSGQTLPPEQSDALSAARGYAQSTLRSAIVLSAGLNAHLYTYLGEFEDFFPDVRGDIKKRIVLKVSDFRSALVQGKFLAKRGLWVSEFRVESGLNCGGHAFASQGYLMGPILDEFRRRRQDLPGQMHPIYAKALTELGRTPPPHPHPIRVTVQGGIGTFEEDQLLRERYEVDGTGWGTPFLLVPEVTNVDEEHLRKLVDAADDDVYLSDSSPLGIPFWNLRTSSGERVRQARIAAGRPGSPCPKGFLCLHNTEFTTTPICTASWTYQSRKLASEDRAERTPAQREAIKEIILARSCLCQDLAGAATGTYGIDPHAVTAVCCGPNIVNFCQVATLEEMVGHIYGRSSLLSHPERPHMFIRELMLQVDFIRREIDRCVLGLEKRTSTYFSEFRQNLLSGIEHYRELAATFAEERKPGFLAALQALQEAVEQMPVEAKPAV